MRLACILLASLLAGCNSAVGPDSSEVCRSLPSAEALRAAYFSTETLTSPADLPADTARDYDRRLAQLAAAARLAEDDPAASAAAEIARMKSLATHAANSAGVFREPGDAEIEVAYQTYLASLPKAEYHLAHILVPTRQVAEAALVELDSGIPFADAARRFSADDSRGSGGDLGWIRRGGLPDGLFDAADTLAPGAYSREPVQTEYGWHIVQLIGSRPMDPPALDRVRAQLVTDIKSRRFDEFLQNAQFRDQATSGH